MIGVCGPHSAGARVFGVLGAGDVEVALAVDEAAAGLWETLDLGVGDQVCVAPPDVESLPRTRL